MKIKSNDLVITDFNLARHYHTDISYHSIFLRSRSTIIVIILVAQYIPASLDAAVLTVCHTVNSHGIIAMSLNLTVAILAVYQGKFRSKDATNASRTSSMTTKTKLVKTA